MEKDIVTVPFVAHESAMNRMERTNKRLSIIAIVELVVILIMFAGIMIYFYLPTEVEKVEQEVNNAKNNKIEQKVGK